MWSSIVLFVLVFAVMGLLLGLASTIYESNKAKPIGNATVAESNNDNNRNVNGTNSTQTPQLNNTINNQIFNKNNMTGSNNTHP
jgi:hypothetical protein